MKKLLVLLVGIFIIINSNAQTYVSGGIYSNTTWTAAGSPYIVTGNVVVFPGVTLTIQPGVTVKIDTTVEIEIRQATLMALGTSADSITFMGGNATTSNDREWRTIDLNGKSATSSRFAYCHFTHAWEGIFDEQDTGTLYVSHSLFTDNHCGLLPKESPVQVDSCNFINNVWGFGENAGWLSAGGCSVNACNFFYNTNGLYEMLADQNIFPAITITNCVFEYNVGPGADGLNFALVNNCVAKYNNCGIRFFSNNGMSSRMNNCIMDSNVTGTTLSEKDSVFNCNIEYNTVGLNDLNASFYGLNVIQSNVIDNNVTGLNLKKPDNHISCNSICNNSVYNLTYTGTTNTSVAYNYWCLPDSVQIRATITDGHQNINYGLMFISPFDTAACTNGCICFVSATATKNVVCAGDSTILTAHVMDPNPVYTAVWNPGNHTGTTFTVTPLANTTYTVVVTDSSGCSNTAYITIDTSCIISPPTCNLTVTAVTTYTTVCSGDSTVLYANVTDANPIYAAVWNPGNYIGLYYHVTPTSTTTYTVIVTDSSGCKDTSNVTVYVIPCGPPNPCSSLYPPAICYVSVDTSSTFNIVVWQKTGMDTLLIDSVIIYRQNILNTYVPIGEVSVHAHTKYNDHTALPLVEPYFYALGIHDSCGTDSILSNFNETVFLQSSVAIGHNVVNLNWNFYQGTPVTYYRILRDDSGTGNWHPIDSVQGSINSYSDRNAPINNGLRYLLDVDWNISCTPSRIKPPHSANHYIFNTDNEAYSNMTYLFPSSVPNIFNNNSITIYPNPVSDAISISFHNAFEGIVKITDVLGQDVYTSNLSADNGSVKKINVSNLSGGVYFITLEQNGNLYRTKIIKM